MTEKGLYFLIIISLIALSVIIPAYAEVTSLKTDFSFYKGGTKIYFSGTTQDAHEVVNLVIFKPDNQFALLQSGITDSNHEFKIVIDTSIADVQHQMSLKGFYNASAFITNQANAKTVNFIFSPDGSSAAPFAPTSLTSSTRSSTEIDLNWSAPTNNGGSAISGYKIERNDGNGFNQIQIIPSTSYQNTGLNSGKQYSFRVFAINPSGTSDPSNVATSTTLSSTTPTPTPTPPMTNTTLSLDELIKQRMEAARRLQELRDGKSSGGSNTQQGIPPTHSGLQKSTNLNENVGLNDLSDKMTTQKSKSGSDNILTSGSLPNFEIKNILYPVISLVGVGIIVVVYYSRKKRKLHGTSTMEKEILQTVELTPEEPDDDYAMMILKNRLAKGEITIDEFKVLKEELSEP